MFDWLLLTRSTLMSAPSCIKSGVTRNSNDRNNANAKKTQSNRMTITLDKTKTFSAQHFDVLWFNFCVEVVEQFYVCRHCDH